jgi:branched-chain amino acid transport system permease protein
MLSLTAIRDDDTAAGGLGVNDAPDDGSTSSPPAGCGLAGGVITANTLRVQPDAAYSVNITATMIFIVMIGGIGTIEGPILGAVLYFVLQRQLSSFGAWYLVVLGVVAILVTLLAPKGIWDLASHSGLRLFPVGYRVGERRRGNT